MGKVGRGAAREGRVVAGRGGLGREGAREGARGATVKSGPAAP